MPRTSSNIPATGTALVPYTGVPKPSFIDTTTDVPLLLRVAAKVRAFVALNDLDINKVRVRWGNSRSSKHIRPKFQIESLENPGVLFSKHHYSGKPDLKGRKNYIDGNLIGSTDYKWIIARIAKLGGAVH